MYELDNRADRYYGRCMDNITMIECAECGGRGGGDVYTLNSLGDVDTTFSCCSNCGGEGYIEAYLDEEEE